jgi:hypothetical protein
MWAAVVIGAFAAVAQPIAPWCGTKDRDIGRGFVFTQYMFNGSPEFSLHFRPPLSASRTTGVSLTGPFELSFIQMRFDVGGGGGSSLIGPHIGFLYYPFAKVDGTPFTGTVKLSCGGRTALRERYILEVPGKIKGPIEFSVPWLNQPEQRCIQELQDTGHFALTFAEPEGAPPTIAISGHIPLAWATKRIRTIWAAQLEDAKHGRCRLMPPPPSPF